MEILNQRHKILLGYACFKDLIHLRNNLYQSNLQSLLQIQYPEFRPGYNAHSKRLIKLHLKYIIMKYIK